MSAKLELYEPLHDHLKIKNKRGTINTFVYVVTIGPIVKICPSERSAFRYLKSKGFEFNCDNGEWIHTFKSEDVINLENNYRKH